MFPKSYTKIGLVVFVLIIVVVLSNIIIHGPFKNTQLPSLNLVSSFSFAFESQNLARIVQQDLDGKKGEYSVYIGDLTDSEIYTLRSSDSFPAASLYKLYLLAAILREVDRGNLGLEDVLSSDIDHLKEVLGELDFGYEENQGDIKYNVQEALERVGRISDNFAAIMLSEKIGWDKVQAMVDEMGATSTIIKSPITTSASDIGNFFKALYQKKVVNESVSNQVIEFLSLSKINDRLPAGVPKDVRVVHKTGELAGVRHDAGIIYLPTSTSEVDKDTSEVYARAYVIVLMSKDLQYEDDGVETLAKISKDVYEYFKNKSD